MTDSFNPVYQSDTSISIDYTSTAHAIIFYKNELTNLKVCVVSVNITLNSTNYRNIQLFALPEDLYSITEGIDFFYQYFASPDSYFDIGVTRNNIMYLYARSFSISTNNYIKTMFVYI